MVKKRYSNRSRVRDGDYSKHAGKQNTGKYTAPTSGLEDVVFNHGSVENAAEFEENKTKLVRYIATQTWRMAAAAGNALDNMAAPPLAVPRKPNREFKQDSDGKATKDPLISDDEYKMDVELWIYDMKECKQSMSAWTENNSRMFNLLLQHTDPELEEVLRTLSKWEQAKIDQDSIALIHMIRDVSHKHDETKQGTMAHVEAFYNFATVFQKPGQSNDEYAKLFRAQVETVNAHGGAAGHHERVYDQHLSALVLNGTHSHIDDYLSDK